ncbi:MAG: hypothetical protein Q4C75_02000 [Bergeyella zoohelcum]|nr:hypothetical protein [Bergeyella zoohelcum]
MKNIDIEQIERKNNYKTPENFFQEMQDNVLRQTIAEKPHQTKIYQLKSYWAYGVAASLLLVFGLVFFINQPNEKPQIAITDKPHFIEKTSPESTEKNIEPTEKKTDFQEDKIAFVSPKIETNNKAVTKKEALGSEAMSQVINVMSEEEITDFASKYEQDVYFELY